MTEYFGDVAVRTSTTVRIVPSGATVAARPPQGVKGDQQQRGDHRGDADSSTDPPAVLYPRPWIRQRAVVVGLHRSEFDPFDKPVLVFAGVDCDNPDMVFQTGVVKLLFEQVIHLIDASGIGHLDLHEDGTLLAGPQ